MTSLLSCDKKDLIEAVNILNIFVGLLPLLAVFAFFVLCKNWSFIYSNTLNFGYLFVLLHFPSGPLPLLFSQPFTKTREVIVSFRKVFLSCIANEFLFRSIISHAA